MQVCKFNAHIFLSASTCNTLCDQISTNTDQQYMLKYVT
jgi:hypothetical protein